MNNEIIEEKKKSKAGLIIILIFLLLLILFAVWYFLIRDKGETTPTNNGNNTQETDNKDEKPKENKTIEYNYTDGVLTQIVDEEGKPLQTDFVIDGIILVGNRHSYANLEAGVEGIMEKLVQEGYKKEGINSSFYLNEWIEIYLDTKYTGKEGNVRILITPHKTVEEYQKMTAVEIVTLAEEKGAVIEYKTPDVENHKYVGNGYVSMDYPEGKYDILFMYNEKLAYFINITESKEPTE